MNGMIHGPVRSKNGMNDIFKLILFMVVIPLASIYVYEEEEFEWEQYMKNIISEENENDLGRI